MPQLNAAGPRWRNLEGCPHSRAAALGSRCTSARERDRERGRQEIRTREGSVSEEEGSGKEASHPALVSVISRGRALSGERVVLPEALTASSLLPPAAEEVLMEEEDFTGMERVGTSQAVCRATKKKQKKH